MKKVIFRVLFIFSVILLFIAIIRIANNQPILDSFSLLQALSNAPKLIPNTLVPLFEITGEWVVLDGLRIFLNSLGTILGALGYFAIEAINLLGYIFYFIRIIFVS